MKQVLLIVMLICGMSVNSFAQCESELNANEKTFTIEVKPVDETALPAGFQISRIYGENYGSVGRSIYFSVTVSGASITSLRYNWTLQGGNLQDVNIFSSYNEASYSFKKTGTYMVWLTVTDPATGESRNASLHVTIS